MSYGLIVKSFDGGGNEITQIDTNEGYIQYVITHMGYGSQVNVSGISPRSKILVKPATEADGTYSPVLLWSTGQVNNYEICIQSGTRMGPTLKFLSSDPGAIIDGLAANEAYTQIACNYIILQDVAYVTATGDYGLQTLTAGGDTAFDSRKVKFNSKLSVNSIIPAGAVGGAAAPTDLLSSDSNNYIDITPSFWDDIGNKLGIKVQGGTQNTYYMHVNSIYLQPGSGLNNGYYAFYYDNFGVIWLANLV